MANRIECPEPGSIPVAGDIGLTNESAGGSRLSHQAASIDNEDRVAPRPSVLYRDQVEGFLTGMCAVDDQVAPVARPVDEAGGIRDQLRLSPLGRHDKYLAETVGSECQEAAIRRRTM